MWPFFYVGAGGFIGSVLRYSVSGIALHRWPASNFPIATFLVNISGCLAIGILAGAIQEFHILREHQRLFLITGVLGGFTTFSAFEFESVFLLRKGEIMFAVANLVGSVAGGFLAVGLGMLLVKTCSMLLRSTGNL